MWMQGNTGLCSNDPFHALHVCKRCPSASEKQALPLRPIAISKDGCGVRSGGEYNSCFCCHLHHLMNRKDPARIKRPKESSWTKDPPFIRVPYCCTVTFVCFVCFFFKTMQLYILQCIHLSHITPCVHIRNINARRSCLPVCPADCF